MNRGKGLGGQPVHQSERVKGVTVLIKNRYKNVMATSARHISENHSEFVTKTLLSAEKKLEFIESEK